MPFSMWINFLMLFPGYLELCFPGVLALGTSQGRSSSRRILRLVQVPGEKKTKWGCGKWAWSPSHRSQWKSIMTLQKTILNLPISGIFRLLKEPEQLWERLNWPILTHHGKDFSFPLTDAQGSDSKCSWLVFLGCWAKPAQHHHCLRPHSKCQGRIQRDLQRGVYFAHPNGNLGMGLWMLAPQPERTGH